MEPTLRLTRRYGRVIAFLLIVLLLGATLAAFFPMSSSLRELSKASQPLIGQDSPNGLQSLSLSRNASQARQILDTWGDRRAAKQTIEIDQIFVWRYACFFILLATFAAAWAYLSAETFAELHLKPSWPLFHWLGLLATVVLLVFADIGENCGLLRLLDSQLKALALTRLFTQAKLTALLLFSLGTLLAIGLGVRRTWRSVQSVPQGPTGAGAAHLPVGVTGGDFKDVIGLECKDILEAREGVRPVDLKARVDLKVRKEAAGEPWINPCRETFVGLALSGGGIRSATFNLGLLQGLHRLDLLHHVDYLATVSGGGYIGGFWSKWLHQQSPAVSEIFPDELKESTGNPSIDTRIFESEEVRHLREFSNFLSPRVGLFDTELWGAVVVFLAALIPALLAGLSVLGLSLIAWFALTFYLACLKPLGGGVFIGLFTAFVLLGLEWWWRKEPTGDPADSSRFRVVVTSAAASLAVAWLHGHEMDMLTSVKRWPWKIGVYGQPPWTGRWTWSPIPDGYDGWWTLVGLTSQGGWVVSPRLYEPSLMWGAVALALLLLRFRGTFARPSMERRVTLPTADRTTMRLVALAVLWAVVATFWHLGLNLKEFCLYLLAGAGTGGGLFALLRNWIGGLAQQPKAGMWDRVKPYLPMLLAYMTVGLAWAGVSSALSNWGGQDWYRWYLAAGAMALVTTAVLLVDPADFGLHAMYRERIARAYLGAARAGVKASDNRATDLRRDDDINLHSLSVRPLHLVCCAANDLSGDPVATLSRGARSAALSRNGVMLGDAWEVSPDVTLASALTASAAAFNSNMGAVSVQVGPAVAFLMSTLNLRLGLWVGNPSRRPTSSRRLPGWLYYKEMFSLTSADGMEIHLSDGAHFDNLGLYELVRRHCRYIIVSDCTADPDVAFDDFGRTARRIREDFGVEIDVNLDALKPGIDHLVRQYAIVGTIDYGWFDKGILVYVKPGLIGSEPPDILQYKRRNNSFPHESTGDQFYDEAQWESYRRLGVQAAREVFKFVEHFEPAAIGGADVRRAQMVFSSARQVWYPTPAGLVERILEVGDRFSFIESELRRGQTAPMLIEVFPELAELGLRAPAALERTQESELANLGSLLRVTQVMEDAILACALESNWNHPLNIRWVNAFARWATAPTFRAWWPFLRPMYSPGLRTFLEERFPVVRDAGMPLGAVSTVGAGSTGLALGWWRSRDHMPSLAGRELYQYVVRLPERDGTEATEVQLALVAVTISGHTAKWTSEDFFVPLSLWGGGFGGRFLQELLPKLSSRGVRKCEVTVKGPDKASASRAQWNERREFVDFYRQSGFLVDHRRTNTGEAVLLRSL